MADIGKLLRGFAEGMLQQQFGPDFRAKQRAAESFARRGELETEAAPEDIKLRQEKARSSIATDQAQLANEGLRRSQLSTAIEEHAQQKVRLRKAAAAGLIPSEDLKIAEFVLNQRLKDIQMKSAEANIRQSDASAMLSGRRAATLDSPDERQRERNARIGLLEAQAEAARALGANRERGPQFKPANIPPDVLTQAEEYAKQKIGASKPGLLERLGMKNRTPTGVSLPSLDDAGAMFDPRTLEHQNEVGRLMQEFLQARGFSPDAMKVRGLSTPKPGETRQGPNGQLMRWVPDAPETEPEEDDLF